MKIIFYIAFNLIFIYFIQRMHCRLDDVRLHEKGLFHILVKCYRFRLWILLLYFRATVTFYKGKHPLKKKKIKSAFFYSITFYSYFYFIVQIFIFKW
jgi:hypothetical protein